MPLMSEDRTTIAVQRYLVALANVQRDTPAEPIVQALLARSVDRLRLICGAFLSRSYPRLARPPLNLDSDELVSAVVERLLKALQAVRPTNVRQFFALANRHIRWELNDLARRLDEQEAAVALRESGIAAPDSSGSQLSPNSRRILEAIEALPEEEREVFGLVRIQGMTQTEAADVLGVSPKTIQRRLNRGLILLADKLADLEPA